MRSKKYYLILLAIAFMLNMNVYSEVVIVANKNSGLASLSKNDLIKLYNGRIKSINGKSIKPILMTSGSSHDSFCKDYLNRSASALSKIWKKLVFTGKARMPETASNDQDMQNKLRSKSDSIGYMEREQVGDDLVILEVK